MSTPRIEYANDATESIPFLLRLRLPALGLGLLLGVGLSFLTSRFEEVLATNTSVAFFIPFIVYLADAVGTQTQSIYIRALKTNHANLHQYLFKETAVGVLIGLLFGVLTAAVVQLWFGDADLTLAVSLATVGAISSAPPIALLVTRLSTLEHTDPAVGAGPIATVVQDMVSVLIYGLIASALLL